MSDKFHINPETGNPGRCSAQPGNCPFGDASEHFATTEQAREHFEKQNTKNVIESSRKLPNRNAQADGQAAKPPIDAGIEHARSLVMATTIKANSKTESAQAREIFDARNRVAWEYRTALENLQKTGKTSPEDLIRLAEGCEVRAVGAEKARGWTPNARRRNAARMEMYNYLAGTARQLAAGEKPSKS